MTLTEANALSNIWTFESETSAIFRGGKPDPVYQWDKPNGQYNWDYEMRVDRLSDGSLYISTDDDNCSYTSGSATNGTIPFWVLKRLYVKEFGE